MSARTLDELFFHWRAVIGAAPEGWARGFALSIQRNRRQANWKPTAKQLALMQQMVAELFTHADSSDGELIEKG